MKKTLPPAALRPAPDAALVAMPRPAETLDRAGRANFFHRLSREAGAVAIRAALAAGVELLEARREMAGGFQRWVQAKCAFGVATAYNYIRLAEATLPEAAVPALLEGSDEERERAVEEAADAADSRTLTDLYADLGIVRRTPSKMGGARPGAGRPRKGAPDPAAEIAAEADPDLNWAEVSGYLKGLYDFAIGEDGFGTLSDDDLETLVVMLGECEARAKALLKARREGGAA